MFDFLGNVESVNAIPLVEAYNAVISVGVNASLQNDISSIEPSQSSP